MLTEDDLQWFQKYTRAVIYLASEERENPFRPGCVYYPIMPDGIGYYRHPFISDYYNAIETTMVPLSQIKITIRDYFIPQYALSWMKAEEKRFVGNIFEYYGIDGDIWTSEGRHLYPFRKEEPQKEGWTEESPQFLVKNVYEYYRQSGDLSVFEENYQVLEEYLLGHPRYFLKDNGMIYFEDEDVFDESFRKRGYGFFDTILLTGYICFPTLLYWEAYMQMGEMFGLIGCPEKQSFYYSLAEKISRNLLDVFWDEENQLLLAATGANRQASIWDSAYAACIGILDDDTVEKISKSLVRNYDKIVYKGQVRHMIEPEGWEKVYHTHAAVNRYQNGAYWGTASGWVFQGHKKNR